MDESNGLIEKLRSRQGKRPNSEFAADIGLSRQMWDKVLRKEKRLGVHSLRLIHVRYPDLADDLLGYVLCDQNSE